MEADPRERPRTAAALEEWRAKKRLRVQKLAELSDVSATYIRLIEAGVDDDGRQVVPSASIIQKLARGLAKVEESEGARAEEERRIYADLMTAAGYLDATQYPQPPPVSSPARPAAHDRDRAAESYPARADVASPAAFPHASSDGSSEPSVASGGVTVVLKDPRLRRHCHDLLAHWDAYSSEDQALVLGILEFVVERRRRRERLS